MNIFRKNRFLLTVFVFIFLTLYQRTVSLPVNDQAVTSQHVLGEHAQVSPEARQEAQVVRVVDGDTFEVLLNNKKEKVRVIGINTPETVDPRRPVQCFGKEASNFAKQTLTGQQVTLESDPTQSNRDKYKRLLRYVWLKDETIDFGKLMIASGYAHEYTYDIPYQYQVVYREAERHAREDAKGLWSNAACTHGSS